jgi:cytochrome c-type biogenesis protein CcmE
VVGTLGWLAVGGTNEAASYYKTIAEIEKMAPGQQHKQLRVGGFVEAGSIKRAGNQVEFMLIEEDRRMKVRYAGSEPLPDTFKDGSQALIDGRIHDGVFEANKIAAKCASKYESKPGQNYKQNSAIHDKKS